MNKKKGHKKNTYFRERGRAETVHLSTTQEVLNESLCFVSLPRPNLYQHLPLRRHYQKQNTRIKFGQEFESIDRSIHEIDHIDTYIIHAYIHT